MNVIFYDGDCSFCAAIVQFVLKRDVKGRFHFAAIQSDAGRGLLAEHGVTEPSMDTMYFIEDTRFYERSTAVLRVARKLPGYRVSSSVCLCIPRPLRDLCYRFIARNRHKILQGRSCAIPSESQKERFLGL